MLNRLKIAAALGAAILLSCVAFAKDGAIPLKPDAEAALAKARAASSGAERIKDDLAYIADDARKGRDTGSAGFLDAAHYVAARYEAEGLSPGADGGWFQNVPFVAARRKIDAARFDLSWPGGDRERLVNLDDYVIGVSVGAPRFDISAPLVFVGYGVVDKATGRDDYAGVDAKGKIVIAFVGSPALGDTEREAYFSSGATKEKLAAAHGAVGFITVSSRSSEARRPWRNGRRVAARPDMTWVSPGGAPHRAAPSIVATARLSHAGAVKLFKGAARSFDEVQAAEEKDDTIAAFDLPAKARLRGAETFEKISSANVVAMIEGANPNLANEAIVLSAHLDHLGKRSPKEKGGDGIYNGALDNGIGVATMLAVARKFEEGPPPRRAIYFVAQTGEEKGLLGSDYFAHYPTVGSHRIVANVDLDMPLVTYHFTDIVAFGAKHSSLGAVVRDAAKSMGIALIPDPMPEEGIFTRSDHYSFVKQGVPAVFLFLGFGNGGEKVFRDFMKTHYHKQSDDLSQPIDYNEAARFAELNYRVARRIADADEAPSWNKGDFFGDLFAKPANGSGKPASHSH